MSGTDRFDGLLMQMAQQEKGIEPMLTSVFSFLRRKTDFFSGASQDKVEETVLTALRREAALAERERYERKQQEEKDKNKRLEAKRKKEAEEEARKKTDMESRFEEITEDEPSPVAASTTKSNKDKNPADDDESKEDDDGPAPEGNGGKTEHYVWTQTLQEAHVTFPVPDGTLSKQVAVEIRSNSLKVGLKGQEWITDGHLHKRIKVEDSFWTLEDGNRICIYLQKENQMEWWKCIIQGDPEIDTKKVQPENSKLSDLDGDTRQTVEKMMVTHQSFILLIHTITYSPIYIYANMVLFGTE
jgi:hypothetical protein